MTRRAPGTGSVLQRKNGTWAGAYDAGLDGYGRRRRRWVYAKTRQEVEAKLDLVLGTPASPRRPVSARTETHKCDRCGEKFPIDDLFRGMCGGCYPWGQPLKSRRSVRHPDRGPEWRHFECVGCGASRWTRQPALTLCALCNRRSRAEDVEAAVMRGRSTPAQWAAKLAAVGCCVYCGATESLTKDHATPISRGGSDSIGNLVPACFVCNCRKGKMTAAEFIRWRAQR